MLHKLFEIAYKDGIALSKLGNWQDTMSYISMECNHLYMKDM